MKNHTSYETSVRLKNAGLPQPKKYEFGQVWWFVLNTEPDCLVITKDEEGFNSQPSFVFAPTATDVLRLLEGFDIGYFTVIYEGWVMFDVNGGRIAKHKNPAEAAALAWLKLNEKQAEK